MENTKKNYSVKSKLVSAIAMLLVATIMLVSSTYAWFTLSTKPEVSGISTAVGANGALEMLLATQDENGAWVYGTGTVNSEDAKVRNTYWGNLVDLSDTSYGSGLITLYPALLSVTDTGAINTGAPIKTPVYGADGRVNSVEEGGMFAIYDVDERAFLESSNYGFRAIGIASGLTARQQSFRVALSQILVNQSSAQAKARTSLSDNGNTLAAIAVKKAMGTSDEFSAEEIAAVGDMIEGIKEALAAVEEAYVQFIYAYINSTESGLEDLEATAAINEMDEAIAGLSEPDLGDKVTAALGAIGKDTSVLPTYSKFEESIASVAQAESAYANVSAKDTCTWNDLSPALTPLVKVDAITINGFAAGDVKENTSEIVNQVVAGKGLNVKMLTGGGVYADIADFAGNYTVGIEIDTALLNTGIDAGVVPATMKAETTLPAAILTAAKTSIEAKAPTDDGALKPITEFYGYVVDLAFRTNATTSNLLLQTAPADRIYNGNQNEETAGKGSTMTFATTDANFTMDSMLDLMSKLNVVFYDTLNGEILAKAKLDTALANVEGTATDGVTANLYIVEEVTETTGEGEEAVTTTREELVTEQADAVITALDTNQEKHVSVLVYLNGEDIENSDVAANAAQSLTGTFNIQFASSAELQPMEYSDLHTTTPSTEGQGEGA